MRSKNGLIDILSKHWGGGITGGGGGTCLDMTRVGNISEQCVSPNIISVIVTLACNKDTGSSHLLKVGSNPPGGGGEGQGMRGKKSTAGIKAYEGCVRLQGLRVHHRNPD